LQAIILAAGIGSRLGKITGNYPKSLIQIHGRTMLDYNLDMLSHYGIHDIVLVTGYQTEVFENKFREHSNIRMAYNPFYETTNVLTSFWFGQPLLHDDFIYMHADTLCDLPIFERLLESKEDITLPVDFGPCNEEAMKVRIDNGQLIEINKTMPLNIANGEFIGIAKFFRRCLPGLKEVVNKMIRAKQFSAFFEIALQEIINIKTYSIATVPTNGQFWSEIDFMEDYYRACKYFPQTLINLPSTY